MGLFDFLSNAGNRITTGCSKEIELKKNTVVPVKDLKVNGKTIETITKTKYRFR